MNSSNITRMAGLASKLNLNHSQGAKLDRLFMPSAFVLTFAGLGLSMFSLHQLDVSRRQIHCWRISDAVK